MTITQGEIFDAILELRPNATFEVHEDKSITWLDENQTQPTMSEIEAQVPTSRVNSALRLLRIKRDRLLQETDYIVIKAKETGTTIPTAWKTYRQELRDLTNGLTTVDEINEVTWPTKPE